MLDMDIGPGPQFIPDEFDLEKAFLPDEYLNISIPFNI